MKATTQTGITLDRISTREELVEVMDMLCRPQTIGRTESGAFPAPPVCASACGELSFDALEGGSDEEESLTELNSLTNLLLGDFKWVN